MSKLIRIQVSENSRQPLNYCLMKTLKFKLDYIFKSRRICIITRVFLSFGLGGLRMAYIEILIPELEISNLLFSIFMLLCKKKDIW